MRTVVFINAHSRKASRYLSAIQKFFDAHTEFELVDYIVVEDLKEFDASLDRLRGCERVDYVIVGSGDGTVMTVLNTLKDRKDLTYGFLPLGTTNVFARNLDIPLNFKKSLQVIADQHIRQVSLGSVNGVLFVNAADVGLSTHVVKQMDNQYKRLLGSLAYYLLALGTLPRYKPLQCEVKIGGHTRTIRTYDLAVLNGRYYGPISVTKAGSVYNDKLTILYGTDLSRFGFVNDVNSFFLGRQHKRRNVFMISASEMTIKTGQPQDIQADGEIIGKTPAKIKVIKDAIRVLVPPAKQP